MAAEKETEEMETFVQEFLDKTFGDRLEDLGTAAKTVESLERKRDLLKTKLTQSEKNTKLRITEAEETAKHALEKMTTLVEKGSQLEVEVHSHIEQSQPLISKLNDLCNELKVIDRMQIYLSWIVQINQLSEEIETQLKKGSIGTTVDLFTSLIDLSTRLESSSCSNLSEYAKSTANHWLKVLSDILSSDVEKILTKMKWPFPSGISSPALENKEGTMLHFEALILYILKLQPLDMSYGSNGKRDLLLASQILSKPMKKRFHFHFYGNRQTNNPEKPEWYFTQILNWIRDHTEFLEHSVQPLLDRSGFSQRSVKDEFMQVMLQLCIAKMKSTLPHVVKDELLFSHLIDEALLFEKELRSVYEYPVSLPGCIHVLLTEPYLNEWLELERKYAVKSIEAILEKEEAWKPRLSELGESDDFKAPLCAEEFMTLLAVITERYQSLGESNVQLKFADLQLELLHVFVCKLQNAAKRESTWPDKFCYCTLVNGIEYIIHVLQEWTEQVFFIQLHCEKVQKSHSSPKEKVVRLDDSITEETMDIDLSTNQQDSESLLQRTIFDEIINSLEEFSNALVATLIEQLETGLKLKVSRYKEERWHALPSPKQMVVPILSNHACRLMLFIKEQLKVYEEKLCQLVFTKVWQKFARVIDSLIFKEVVQQSHFNDGGAAQFQFDMIKNLFVLFGEHTQKPETYFRQIKEACVLLNLLPGSAVLLKNVLEAAVKSKGQEQLQKEKKAKSALKDIGLVRLSIHNSLSVLNSRIDLPRL